MVAENGALRFSWRSQLRMGRPILFGVENIWRGRKFESRHVLFIPGRCFNYAGTRTLFVDSLRQIFKTKPTTVEFIGERPSTGLLCPVFLAGSEKAMQT